MYLEDLGLGEHDDEVGTSIEQGALGIASEAFSHCEGEQTSHGLQFKAVCQETLSP